MTVQIRKEWLDLESHESASQYQQALLDSEYTIAPAGRNTESYPLYHVLTCRCYRFYEAFASGSVPIIEDVSHGACETDALALLKAEKAPAIYVKTWEELPEILR